MITGDIGAHLEQAVRAEVARGGLPPGAAAATAAGTWRRAPQRGGGPRTYATSLPFTLAGTATAALAERLAASLRTQPWIEAVSVTGGGYLTITVTTAHLTGLPARILADPAAAATSSVLRGSAQRAPRLSGPLVAPTWELTWREHRRALIGRIAQAAGAQVMFDEYERISGASARTGDSGGQVAKALAYYGADAVGYALARAASGRAGAITRQLTVPLNLANPFFAVRYAHADAVSARRWADGLGIDVAAAPPERLAEPGPAELALLDAMSWLPERVGAAARRRRPAELTAYLEFLAAAWLDCRESCPALPFGGRRAPAVPGGDQAAARIALAGAAAQALSSGLGLLGVTAPARL